MNKNGFYWDQQANHVTLPAGSRLVPTFLMNNDTGNWLVRYFDASGSYHETEVGEEAPSVTVPDRG